MSDFQRSVTFEAGYDRRSSDPSKNYGIHGVTVRWVVKRDNKAVQFVVFTDWDPLNVQKERMRNYVGEHIGVQPMAADLGYHSPMPLWDGQTLMDKDCPHTGGPCYYDGSGLNAEPVRDRLLAEGDAAVWAELEDYWHSTFAPATEGQQDA